jgi:hypothetical protein
MEARALLGTLQAADLHSLFVGLIERLHESSLFYRDQHSSCSTPLHLFVRKVPVLIAPKKVPVLIALSCVERSCPSYTDL